MSKSKHGLTEKQLKELKKIVDEINTEAEKVVEDYVNNPSEISGSSIHIHENSPYLDERIPEESNWKKVLKGVSLEEGREYVRQHIKDKKA